METPKKKHLIELMIEVGVKWPDGAEYAVQDERNLYVWFYSIKPKRTDYDSWVGGVPGSIIDGHKLTTLCRNWHQTIVTREQYAEAVAAAGNASEPAVDAVEWHNPPSIEQLTSDYYAKAAEADRLQAIADVALKQSEDALRKLRKACNMLGLAIFITTPTS